jgi:ABC-type Fe3+-hydroxamate transport system substrate-binding protein
MFCKITDQLDRIIELPALPQRIISLVPSQTELLIDLGLKERLVGVTRFCVHPSGLANEVTVVGGTKKIVKNRILDLQPDLIICNKEENTPEIVAFCDQIAPTYISDVNNLNQARDMILDLGTLTGTSFKAKSLSRNIQMGFNAIPVQKKVRSLYLIWKDPYMGVGDDTFIHDIMIRSGFENALASTGRYPELTMADVVKLQPEQILLSSEPYPFKQEHIKEIEAAFKNANPQHAVKPNIVPKIKLVDGEMFSWYGSRLLKTPEYLKTL